VGRLAYATAATGVLAAEVLLGFFVLLYQPLIVWICTSAFVFGAYAYMALAKRPSWIVLVLIAATGGFAPSALFWLSVSVGPLAGAFWAIFWAPAIWLGIALLTTAGGILTFRVRRPAGPGLFSLTSAARQASHG
jgi:hypothetical protein